MKQYTMGMAVVASLLVVILLGTVLMPDNEPKDDVTATVTKTNTALPTQPVDNNDSIDQAVTVQNNDIEQTVTVAE